MAKIRVRKETGNLYFDFSYKGVRCREQTTLSDTPKNRKKMSAVCDRITAAITLGSFNYAEFFPNSTKAKKFSDTAQTVAALNSNNPTVETFYHQWLEEMRPTWRHNYIESVQSIFNTYVLPRYAKEVISNITKTDVLAFRAELAKANPESKKTKAPATINKTLTVFRLMMNDAADRFQFNSPFNGVSLLKVPKSDIQPFTLQEVQTIIDAVRPDYRHYFALRFFSGMRSGEINGLRWKNVDFAREQILVRETYANNRFDYTKNDGSQREIDFTAPIKNALLQQFESTGQYEFVFCNNAGNPLNNQNVCKRIWYPLLKHLGMPKRRMYQTRHTTATLWMAAGENPEWIAKQLGHTSTEMLFKVYSRYVPNLTRRDGSAFETMLIATQEGEQNHA